MKVYLREMEETKTTYLTTVSGVSELRDLVNDMRDRGCYLAEDMMGAVPGDWQYCIDGGQAYVEILLVKTP